MKILTSKKAQVFAIYLVLLTLFLFGLQFLLYYMQEKNVAHSLVSPSALLDLQDRQEIFDMQEKMIIISSARESGLASNNNLESFKNNFFASILKPEQDEFRGFIFANLSYSGTITSPESFFRDVYNFSLQGSSLKVERNLKKQFIARAQDTSKTNFIAMIDYDYSKSYTISFEDINNFKA